MILGRKELSAILLAVGAILFYLVLLSTTPSGAQTGGANEGCQNPQEVQTFTGSNSQLTPSFNITGGTFQINVLAEPAQQGEFASIFIDSIDQSDGLVVPFGGIDISPVEGQVNQSANVLEGPGNFSLRIQSNNTQYEITVFDCVGSQNTTNSNNDDITNNDIINNQNNQSTVSNRVNPRNRGGVTAIANPSRRPRGERTVINVPRRPLPPSGGLPVYGAVAGFALAGAGLLGLGLVIRRGTRG